MFGAPKTQDYEIEKTIQRDVEKQNGTLAGLHLAMTAEKTTNESNDVDPSAAAERGESGEAQWPLRRSLAQVLTCDLVITPDTGLAWACALEAMPKIVMLSHASATNITKHWNNTVALHADQKNVPCWSCHRLHDTPDTCNMNKDKTGVACISDISAELIVSMAQHLLNNGSTGYLSGSPHVTWS